MSNRAWMPLHLDAYLADTGHLTTLEHGAYLLLIMHYWRNGSLPDDERMIARIARLSKDEWAESRDVLATLFRDGWKHKRIDEELAKADDIIAKRKAAAGAMHSKRTAKADAPAEQMQSTCSDTGGNTFNQEPIRKEEPTGSSKKRGTRLPDDFEPDMAQADEAGLSQADAGREALKFRDYWISQPGQRGVKTDWPATWRNWCRTAAERRPPQRSTSPPQRRRNFADVALDRFAGATDGSESVFGNHRNVELIPPDRGKPGSDDEDLRGGVGRRYVASGH